MTLEEGLDKVLMIAKAADETTKAHAKLILDGEVRADVAQALALTKMANYFEAWVLGIAVVTEWAGNLEAPLSWGCSGDD